MKRYFLWNHAKFLFISLLVAFSTAGLLETDSVSNLSGNMLIHYVMSWTHELNQLYLVLVLSSEKHTVIQFGSAACDSSNAIMFSPNLEKSLFSARPSTITYFLFHDNCYM